MLGRTVSHYEILRKLGQGGMGVVYLARDADLDRLVAPKFLRPGTAGSEEKIARFLQEARAISALNHPHIATIYAIEETAEFRFLSLEYLSGGTLKEKMIESKARGEKLPRRLALDWAAEIAQGLAHAHGRGVVHRDVKPSNILFTEDGRVKIVDFGLAKRSSEEDADLTESGQTIGTPRGMSPEQALGRDVDARTDIFSLGLVLFELIAGQSPFRAAHRAALLHAIIYEAAPSLSALRDDVPRALDAVVSKMLAKDPAARFQSMEELIAALRATLESSNPPMLSSSTMTLTSAAPVKHPRRRKHVVTAAAAAAIALAAGIGVDNAMFHGRAPQEEKRIAVLEFTNSGGDPKNQDVVAVRLNDAAVEKIARMIEARKSRPIPACEAQSAREEQVVKPLAAGSPASARRIPRQSVRR